MARSKSKRRKMYIDLSGPDGNSFVLLAMATVMAEHLGKDGHDICARMTSSDYWNLIAVFKAEFGDYIELYDPCSSRINIT